MNIRWRNYKELRMDTEVNEKSKKSEILDAYHSVLKQLQNRGSPTVSEKVAKEEEKKAVEHAKSHSSESIITGLANTKTQVGKILDEVEEKMLTHFKQFLDLQKSIDVASQELKTIHQITVEADSLNAFVQVHKETKQRLEEEIQKRRFELEQEITERKELWKKEKQAYEQACLAEEKERKKLKEREEEEYLYHLKLVRQKDQDAYAIEKAKLESELNEMKASALVKIQEKEKKLAEQEAEVTTLREQVAHFPEKLSAEVARAQGETKQQVESALHFQMELSKKEMEGDKKLYEQKVVTMEAKIKELENQVTLLHRKADEAGKQVQGIAMKAIEGASKYPPHLEYKSHKSTED